MEPKKLLIRVDGGSQIGMGHVMRCLTLARAMQEMAPLEIRFAAREGTEAVDWIRNQGYEAEAVPAAFAGSVSWLRDYLRRARPQAVVTDLREFVPGIPEMLREENLLSVTVDEWGGGKRIVSEILTNGTVVPAWHRYELEGDVRCYLGAPYALLDGQFALAHQRPRQAARSARRLLVALGGDDPFFLTSKVLRLLEGVEGPLEVTAVIGPAFLDGVEIRRLAAASRHRVQVLENVSRMADLMLGCDAAITAGGLIALELACTGTPGFILCEVDHQLETASVLEAQGAAIHWGLGGELKAERFVSELTGLLSDPVGRERMSQEGRRLIDGQGTQRVARAILELLKEREGVFASS